MQFGHTTCSIVSSKQVFLFLWTLLLATTVHATEISGDVAQQSTSTDCYAIYLAEQQELIIPCVDLIDSSGVVTQSYKVTLNQLPTTDGSLQFGLKEWQITLSDEGVLVQEGLNCHSVYYSEQGELLMPCVKVIDSNGSLGIYEVIMTQLNPNLVESFKLEVAEANKIGRTDELIPRSFTRASSFGGSINLTILGDGKVTSSSGSCNSSQRNCSWVFTSLLTTLTAIPNSGKKFIGWDGACKGTTNWCMVSLIKQTKSVTASFTTSVQPCSYTLSPTSVNILATGQQNGLLSVTATKVDCIWTATSNVSWITLNTKTGKGSSGVSYNVTANTDIRSRNGIITIAGSTVAVTQRPRSTTSPPPISASPSAPSSLSANATSNNTVQLTWSDNSNNEAGFYIYRGDGVTPTNFTKIGALGMNVTSYTDNGLQANTTYSYYVVSYNSSGEIKSSYVSIKTQQSPVATQLNITATGSDGKGWIVGNQNGINCKTSCVYSITSPVTLYTEGVTFESGDKEYELDKWEGACSGNGSCTIVPNGQNPVVYVTAKFYLARIKSIDHSSLPYGWAVQSLGKYYSAGRDDAMDAILFNLITPPIGTKVRVAVPSTFLQNVQGWTRENEVCERGSGGSALQPYIPGTCYYNLKKVSNW